MAIDKAEALVTRAVDFSETSKVVTLFTRELGKVKALAKGARRLKGGFEVALDLLSVCRISVLRKPAAELDLLTEAMLLERFDGLRRDLPALYAAYYVAEILDGLTQTGQALPLLYEATLKSLRKLASGEERWRTLARYRLVLVRELGYAPSADRCAACGEQAPLSARVSFGVSAGGVLCARCARHARDAVVLQGATIQAIRLFSLEDGTAARRLAPSERTKRELGKTLDAYITHLLGRQPRTAALLQP